MASGNYRSFWWVWWVWVICFGQILYMSQKVSADETARAVMTATTDCMWVTVWGSTGKQIHQTHQTHQMELQQPVTGGTMQKIIRNIVDDHDE